MPELERVFNPLNLPGKGEGPSNHMERAAQSSSGTHNLLPGDQALTARDKPANILPLGEP